MATSAEQFRRYITINGRATQEFDHSNLQPAMLYALKGRKLDSDAYIIPGLEKHRKLVKTTFFKLINVTGRIEPPERAMLPDRLDWDDFQEQIKAQHQPIAEYFQSGIGLKLQKTDAQIAEDVMLAMMQKDWLAMPLHDGFITYSGQEKSLIELMKSSYHSRMRSMVGVDADPTFLEQEISDEGLPRDEEYPSPKELIEARSKSPEYAGHWRREKEFFERQTSEWHKRFGEARDGKQNTSHRTAPDHDRR